MTLKVQIVGRSDDFQDRLQLALERIEVDGEDLEFVQVRDGNQALAIAEREAPDLVVVEVGVRPYGGFGLSRDLKASAQLSCPVILILERRQDDWLGRWCGADALVNRPVDPFALADVAQRLLAERRGVAIERQPGAQSGAGGGAAAR